MDDSIKPIRPDEQLIRDPLTQAYTRGLLEPRLHEELARAGRESVPLTVCLFDLDPFKSINDAYGHQRGDQVLIELTQVVQQALRTSDALFRYGGDEFVLMLPHTSQQQAAIVCARLVEKVRQHVVAGAPPLSVTISMGVATFPADAQTVTGLLEVADQRNYRAKRQGRNQWVNTSQSETVQLNFDPGARLLERDSQLAAFHQFLSGLPRKGQGLFRVLGEPGSGRTTFLARIEQDARMQNVLVLHLSPTRHLQHRAFGALQQVEGLPALPTAAGPAGVLNHLTRAVTAQGKAGLLLCIDNMSCLDWASRSLLARMLQEPQGIPVGVVYTLNSEELPPQLPVPSLHDLQVVLPPFSRMGLRIWLREVLQWEVPADFLEWVLWQTEGHPARVRGLLKALVDQKLLEQDKKGWTLHPGYEYKAQAGLGSKAQEPTLPVPSTLFFGREKEAQDIERLFERRRLVTLLGPGGIGKSRLSIEVAELRRDHHPGGVWFVGLDSVRSADLVPSSIAQVLGIKAGRRPILEDLKEHLRKEHLLLVLDNFEHVIEAAPVLEELLGVAPGLHLLVTSRERLNLSSEQVYAVPPLGIPARGEQLHEEDAYQYSALSLFLDRTRARIPDLELTPENLGSISRICQQLEGHPLAIELAAAALDMFSLEELSEELSFSRLRLLNEGPRDLSERQRTLRNTIDWSDRLLTESEKWVFHSMGVFVGGWTLPAATAVSRDHLQKLSNQEGSVQSILNKLVGKSLIQFDRTERRFTMLETIREYASEKLENHPQGPMVQQAHALYFLGLVQQAEPYLVGDGQAQWLEVLQKDHGNIRQALQYMLDQQQTLWALQMASGLWKFWQFRNHHREGRKWCQQVLSQAENLDPGAFTPEQQKTMLLLQARIMLGAGWLASDQADHTEMARLFQQSHQAFQEVGDRRGLGLVLQGLGEVEMVQGNFTEAAQCFMDSREIMQEMGDLEEYAWVTDHLGRCYQATGRLQEAENCFTLCRKLFRQHRQDWGEDISTIHLSDVLVRQTKFRSVIELTEPWIQQKREAKDTLGFIYTLALAWSGEAKMHSGNLLQAELELQEARKICHLSGFHFPRIPSVLGLVYLQQGKPQEAARSMLDAIEMSRNSVDPMRYLEFLTLVVKQVVQQGHCALAATIYGAIERLREQYQMSRTPIDDLLQGDDLQLLQKNLSRDRFQQAWQRGREISKSSLLFELNLLLEV